MFSVHHQPGVRCSYAPVFPPLPADQPHRLPPHPLSIYCPTVGSPMSWMIVMAPGDVSVGTDPAGAGNEGTAKDRGTAAPGSNLTSDQNIHGAPGTRPLHHEQDDEEMDEDTLLPGTKHGPAQPH